MITLVVHELGKKPRTGTYNQNVVEIGRDSGSDLVLGNVAVSRNHAKIFLAQDGKYYIQLHTEKNPILLNGEAIHTHTYLEEGDEIQLGRYLIIFSLKEEILAKYLQQKGNRYEARCESCGWLGTLSEHVPTSSCPRCGHTGFTRLDDFSNKVTSKENTASIGLDELENLHTRTRTAKHARIERVGGAVGVKSRADLEETSTCTIGGSESDLALAGFRLGGSASVVWNGKEYEVYRAGFLPRLKINGASKKKSGLKNGDLLTLGKNQFRFVID